VVNTSGSTVTLIGHVRTKGERSAVVGAAWMGHGVELVLDELEVTGWLPSRPPGTRRRHSGAGALR
jgi:hypothetical protein